MGPGVVSAMAGNDAGGISTYSTAGADFGYATLWVIPVWWVLLLVVQMTAARMGAVTGKGFAALIRERFGIRLTAFAMCALLIGNVATTFSEFAGIASGMGLFGVPTWVSVPISAVIVWLLVVKGSYKSVEKIFLAISLVFVTYIVAAFLAGPNWGDVAHATVVPQIPANVHFVSLVISMIGTTIAPWMMFFAQSNVVDKGVGTDHEEMFLQKVDVAAGTVVACLVAWFIIVTTAPRKMPLPRWPRSQANTRKFCSRLALPRRVSWLRACCRLRRRSLFAKRSVGKPVSTSHGRKRPCSRAFSLPSSCSRRSWCLFQVSTL